MECLDTGAMFRAVAFAVLRVGGDPYDEEFAAEVARTIDVRMEAGRVMVDGHDATVEIRGPAVTSAVSVVATNAAVRSELAARQREWVRRRGGGVLEGRDIGTVVFPTAELKIYLTADPAVRARRRAQQNLCKGSRDPDVAEHSDVEHSDTGDQVVENAALEQGVVNGPSQKSDADCEQVEDLALEQGVVEAVAADLAARDRIDITRPLHPLTEAAGAVVVDTTNATCEETLQKIMEFIK